MAYDLEAIRKKYSSNSSNATAPVSSGQGASNNVNYSYNAGGVSVGNSSLEDLRRRYSYEPKTVTARTITSNDQARLRQQALDAKTVNEEEEKKKNKKIFGEGGVLSDVWNWIKGGGKSGFAGQVGFIGSAMDKLDEAGFYDSNLYNNRANPADQYKRQADYYQSLYEKTGNEQYKKLALANNSLYEHIGEGYQQFDPQESAKTLRDLSYDLDTKAQEDIEKGMVGRGTAGQLIGQGVISGTGMLMDYVSGGGLANMFIRSYGNSYNEAKRQGISEDKLDTYALTHAAVEVISEKIFEGPWAKIYGKGGLANSIKGLNRVLGGNSSIASTLLKNFAEEGAEEVAAQLMDYAIDKGLGFRPDNWSADDWTELWQSFVVGGGMGLLGGGANVIRGTALGNQYRGQAQDIINEGLTYDTGTAARDLAERLNNTTPGGYQIYRQIEENQNAYDKLNDTAKIQQAARQLGLDEEQTKILQDDYEIAKQAGRRGQKTNVEKYIAGVTEAYNYAKYGASIEDAAENGAFKNDINETQRQHAYKFGEMARDAADNVALDKSAKVTVEGVTGTIEGIEKKGSTVSIQIKGSDGNVETVEINNMDEAPKAIQVISDAFGEAAGAVYEAYDGKQNFNEFIQAARIVRSAALNSSVAWDAFSETARAKSIGKTLTMAQKQAIWTAVQGTQEHAAKMGSIKASNAAGTQTAGKVNIYGGKVDSRSFTVNVTRGGKTSSIKFEGYDQSKAQKGSVEAKFITVAKAVARMTGADVRLFYDESGNMGIHRRVDPETGRETIGINMANIDASGNALMVKTMSHELTHFIQANSSKDYQALKTFMFDKLLEKNEGMTLEDLIQSKIDREGISAAQAEDEVVADGCEMMLRDSKVFAELARENMTLAQKIKSWLDDFITTLRSLYGDQDADYEETRYLMQWATDLQKLWDRGLKNAVINRAAAEAETEAPAENSITGVSETINNVEETTQMSYRSLAQAAGFEAVRGADGERYWVYRGTGKRVRNITKEDIRKSPIGAMITASIKSDSFKNGISKEDADKQIQFFTDICNMAANTRSFAMTMKFAGSAAFTALKANSDKQYGTTYDFPSICTKTQAMIDAMSADMVKKGRGLSRQEIVDLYRRVFASGNPVNCPECYVFSRWIGIGGLLDNIKKYQDKYCSMTPAQVRAEFNKLADEITAFAAQNGLSFGKAKGKIAENAQKKYNKLLEKIEKAENQGEPVKDSDRELLKKFEDQYTTAKAMTWIQNVYFAGDLSSNKMNPKARVPVDVLFDLNKGDSFAIDYPEAWDFRTTQGAGYGKAITPYAEAVIGEGIMTTASQKFIDQKKAYARESGGETIDNPFLHVNSDGTLTEDAKKQLESARKKMRAQNFKGGQRYSSTSDARPDTFSDFLLACLETQAMGGMVQVYTKVTGAVDAYNTWGFSSNMSLMPKFGGLDADGNIIDTAVGGMSPVTAEMLRNRNEQAGTITIGVNDEHIISLMEDGRTMGPLGKAIKVVRDFIIPYHASGGKAETVDEMRAIQEGIDKNNKISKIHSTDYTRTQGDKVLSDTALKNVSEELWGKKLSDKDIELIHKRRAARIAILCGPGKGKVKRALDMDVIRGSRYLSNLYEKFNGGEWTGITLSKGDVESQIYPNEFWDKSVTYENSGKITQDYLNYCEELGFLHRFSGRVINSSANLSWATGYDKNGKPVKLTDLAYVADENGKPTKQIRPFFWKTLTDRRMYGADGRYLEQKIANLTVTPKEFMPSTSLKKGEFGKAVDESREYDKAASDKLVAEIRGEDQFSIAMDHVRENLNEDQKKNYDFNQKQTIVGGALKHLSGVPQRRYGGTKDNLYADGVGKEVSGTIYAHKNYASDIVKNPALLKKAENAVKSYDASFKYNTIAYTPKTGAIRFDEAPDFDTAREPIPGRQITVNADGKVIRDTTNRSIWHHKWQWVKNDYTGFDVEESWNWSKQYLSVLRPVSESDHLFSNNKGKGSFAQKGIPDAAVWEEQLEYFGLPYSEEPAQHNTKSGPPKQEITSADTSINGDKLPRTFNSNLKFVHFKNGGINIDVGGGKFDNATEYLKDAYDVENMILDPFNRIREFNKRVTDMLQSGKKADTVTCNNCLNVIAEPDVRSNVILECAKAIKPGGEVYFKIYEGNKDKGPGPSKTWHTDENGKRVYTTSWQENRKAKTYIPEIEQWFENVVPHGDIIVATDPKENLPEAYWQLNAEGDYVQFSSGLKIKNGTARWTKDRIDYLYDEYASTAQNYSKAYATFISPEDFLSLTTADLARIESQSRELNTEDLKNYRQAIYLTYDPSEPGIVAGHEGRHRMVALRNAGVKQVPIVIQFYGEEGKSNRQPLEQLELSGQEFYSSKAPGHVVLKDLVPISRAYRGEIEEKFGANGSEEVQFSFVGPTAADISEAERLEKQGLLTSEEIRKVTGVFRGYDGKWRIELDDSEAEFYPTGALQSENERLGTPDTRVMQNIYDDLTSIEKNIATVSKSDLTPNFRYYAQAVTDGLFTLDEAKKYASNQVDALFNGTNTSDEITGFYKNMVNLDLDKSYKAALNAGKTQKYLDNYMKFDKLYKLYPRLRDIKIREISSGDTLGSFNPDKWEILVKKNLKADEKRSVIMHEVQHAIQNMEGFTRGANVNAWSNYLSEIKNSKEYKNLQSRLSKTKKKINDIHEEWYRYRLDTVWDLYDKAVERLGPGFDELNDGDALMKEIGRQINDYKDAWLKKNHPELEKLEKRSEDISEEAAALLNQTFKGHSTGFELYEATAGEIEARDVQARLGLSEEERRAKRPDLDRKNAVFAEDIQFSYVSPQDPIKLLEAEDLERQGLTSEEIRQRTGLFRSMDGKWRMEIDDSEAVYFPDGDAQGKTSGQRTVADYVVHDKLFDIYPEIKDYKVDIEELPDGVGAYTIYANKSIVLREETMSNPDKEWLEVQLRGTFAHEMQHIIQHIEGFAEGTSEETLNYLRNWLDTEVREAVRTDNSLSPYQRKMALWKLDIQIAEIREGDVSVVYENSMGEIEARDTAERRYLNADERKAKRPDVDNPNAINTDKYSRFIPDYSVRSRELTDEERQIVRNAVEKETRRIERENARLKERVEYWKSQTKRSDEINAKWSNVKRLTRDLRETYNVQDDAEAATRNIINEMATEILKGNYDIDKIRKDADALAGDMISHAEVELGDGITVNPYAKDIEGWAQIAREDIVQALLGGAVGPEETFADRKAREIKNLKAQNKAKIQAVKETYQERLKRLRAEKNARIAQIMKEDAIDKAAALAKLRAEKNAQLVQLQKDMAQHQREVKAGQKERKARTETRNKILKLQKKFQQMYEHPKQGSNQHVPTKLSGAVIDLINILNESEIRRNERMAGSTQSQFRREQLAKAAEKLNNLAQTYSNLKGDDLYGGVYDEGIKAMLDNISKALSLGDMGQLDSATLNDIYVMMKAMHHVIVNQNRAVNEEYIKGIKETGEQLRDEILSTKNRHPKLSKYLMVQARPDTFWQMICGYKKGNAGEKIQKMFVAGEERMLKLQQQMYYIQEPLFEKYKTEMNEMTGKPLAKMYDIGLRDMDGKTLKVTRGQMLSIYMHMNCADNMEALITGGLLVPDGKSYYKDGSGFGRGVTNSYAVGRKIEVLQKEAAELREAMAENSEMSEAEIQNAEDRINECLDEIDRLRNEMIDYLAEMKKSIESQLTAFDKELMDIAAQGFQMGADAINEQTEKMYGYKKATVENYFPMHRDLTMVITSPSEAAQRDASQINLQNSGVLKERVKSRAPIQLTDILKEMDSHSEKASRIAGFMSVQRDFDHIYNVRPAGSDISVEGAVTRIWGNDRSKWLASGDQYIQNYLQSVAGANHADGFFGRIRSNTVRATLSLNLRVAMSQLASIPTAAAEVGWGNMMKGYARAAVEAFSPQAKQKLAKENVWFWQRYKGSGGMREIGEVKRINGKFDLIGKFENTGVGKALMNWCQMFDCYATYTMWAMAEEQAKSEGLKTGTDEFKTRTEEVYRNIIRRTQPNYTDTERSDLLRDKSEMKKFLTMYKTQSNQNLNILVEATGKLRAGSGSKAEVANAYTAVIIGGNVAFAGLRALANWILRGFKPKDDEDQSNTFGADVVSGVMNMLMGGSNVYDFISGLSGKYYYGVEDSALGAISDVLTKSVQYGNYLFEGKGLYPSQVNSLMKQYAKALGIPLSNIEKIIEAFGADLFSSDEKLFQNRENKIKEMTQAELANAVKAGEATEEEFNNKYSKDYSDYIKSSSYVKANAKIDLSQSEVKYDASNWEKAFGDSTVSANDKDNLMLVYGGGYLKKPYSNVRNLGYSPEDTYRMIETMDINNNDSVTQEEVYRYISSRYSYNEAERIWDAITAAQGWQSKGVPRSYAYAVGKFG